MLCYEDAMQELNENLHDLVFYLKENLHELQKLKLDVASVLVCKTESNDYPDIDEDSDKDLYEH
jgi:hypothetical protein